MPTQPVAVSVPGGVIHGWLEGRGAQTAVLLHGGPGLSDALEPLAGLLSGTFTTIRYHQRGLPPTTVAEPYTIEANVEDAAAVIDQAAGGRAWIVGFSWGGHLALHVLVACPERVAGAIIIDPLGAFVEAMDEFGENLPSRLSPDQTERVAELDARDYRGGATPEERLESNLLLWPCYFANPATAPPRPPLESNPKCGAETVASIRAHGERGTLAQGLPRVDGVPVLFIHGKQSPMPVRTTTDTAALIPGAEVVLVENAGHFIWLEQPEPVVRAVEQFVGAATAAASRG